MPYIGNQPAQLGAYAVESFNGGGSSFTLSKSATTETVLLFIDGVRQTPTDAYSVSGTTLTTTATTPSGTNNVTVQFLGDVVDFGEPSDNSVTSTKIVDGTIVNADINASAAIALSKLATDPSNASNLSSGTVPTARLASGTADSTTFLRGDQTWASTTPADGSITVAKLSTSATESENVKQRVCKAWVNFNTSSGTPVILDDFNISSITDNGVGVFNPNFSSNMSSGDYAAVASTRHWDGNTRQVVMNVENHTTSDFQIRTLTTSGTAYDPVNDGVCAIVFGDT